MGWGRAWIFPRDRRRSGGLWRLSPRGKGACSYYVALRHPPPRPRFLEGILVRPSPATPTPPALRAPPPPPPGGRGSACDTRWKAVPGSSPACPRAVDRGDIATGGGDRGGGNPLPAGEYPYVALRHPPPRPRFALLPRPHPQEGGSACDSRWKTVPGSYPGSPCACGDRCPRAPGLPHRNPAQPLTRHNRYVGAGASIPR